MESPESPIIQFYPTDFSTDLNGKTQEWESVVLISFIDENLLRDAMKPKLELLSQAGFHVPAGFLPSFGPQADRSSYRVFNEMSVRFSPVKP